MHRLPESGSRSRIQNSVEPFADPCGSQLKRYDILLRRRLGISRPGLEGSCLDQCFGCRELAPWRACSLGELNHHRRCLTLDRQPQERLAPQSP